MELKSQPAQPAPSHLEPVLPATPQNPNHLNLQLPSSSPGKLLDSQLDDAIHHAGMLVVDLVVTHPELEWEIRTQRNQAMELNGVAHGPGKTHGDENGDGKRKVRRAQGTLVIVAVHDPAKVEREERAEGRIREQG